LPLVAEVPVVPPARFVPLPQDALVNVDHVLAHLNGIDMLLIDARNEERFAGQNETLDPVGGHIPGAINRFYFENLDDAGVHFKPAAELRAEFAILLAGRNPDRVVQQCGSGVTACHNLLAMEVAGLSGSKLYPGSWSEWCADPARPVATGPA
jgi:thiosulfate/3-mercaptopyruvate sulfurtransferase